MFLVLFTDIDHSTKRMVYVYDTVTYHTIGTLRLIALLTHSGLDRKDGMYCCIQVFQYTWGA